MATFDQGRRTPLNAPPLPANRVDPTFQLLGGNIAQALNSMCGSCAHAQPGFVDAQHCQGGLVCLRQGVTSKDR